MEYPYIERSQVAQEKEMATRMKKKQMIGRNASGRTLTGPVLVTLETGISTTDIVTSC
jgi:hypothetical protein